MVFIHNINTSTARQEPLKDTKQSRARYLFSFFPNDHTFLGFHLLHLYPPKTFLGLFHHFLFIVSAKCVASKIQLSAWDAVHHPWMLLRTIFSAGTHWPHKRSVWFRPLVEVHIAGSHRNAWVSCIVNAIWYTRRVHHLFPS